MSTLWDKIKAACFRSATVACTYVAAAISFVWMNIDTIASLVGDPNLGGKISDAIQRHPKWVGVWTLILALVMFIARMRSIIIKT